MASARKSRHVIKHFSKLSEESPDKDVDSLGRSKLRKRKLSDMLGSQWSKDELEQFYEAYRRYGKDWKKVAGSIRDRSMDMVVALYNMNKAYLSLPDGMATAAGLIAMMIDHYNNLVGIESDREGLDGMGVSFRAKKRGRGKFKLSSSKRSMGSHSDLLHYQSNTSNFGCLSLLKKKRSTSGDFTASQPRVVGKRTPRFPVSYASERSEREMSVFPKWHVLKLEKDTDEDEGVHVAALALAHACQRGGSPQVSRSLAGKKYSQRNGKKFSELDVVNSKFSLHLNEDHQEGSLGSREAESETEKFLRDSIRKHDYEGGKLIRKKHRVRNVKGKRSKAVTETIFDDTREACSGTEEGLTAKSIKDETSMDICDQKVTLSSHASRISSQLFFGDENREFDALQTLADLSLNMLTPSFAMESESSIQVKDKQNIDVTKEPDITEKLPKHYQRDKTRILANKEEGHQSTAEVGMIKHKTFKTRKLSSDMNACGSKHDALTIHKKQKRITKLFGEKVPKSEVDQNYYMNDPQKIEGAIEDDKNFPNEVLLSGLTIPSSGQVKPAKPPENSSSSTDTSKIETDATRPAPQVSATSEAHLSSGVISRRKIALKKIMNLKGLKSHDNIGENRLDKLAVSANEKAVYVKEALSNCLSSPLLRRWCLFEWFYSAIDYPWFAKSEFVEYLNHVGLGHVPRLTRIEWGVIRSSLGKPRRLSQHFLKEEREKLEQYRESVRSHYAELRAGFREGLPTDLARPLSVGQRVSACHPKMREINDGGVLTVDHDKCLVQFDIPELGVEFVMDVDCMPLNPSENMPDSLRRQNLMVEGLPDIPSGVKPYDMTKDWKHGVPTLPPANDKREMDRSNGYSSSIETLIRQAKEDTIDAVGQAKAAIEATVAAQRAMYTQPRTLAQIQAKEDDIKVLAELARALDRKEVLLKELRKLNADAPLVQNEGENLLDMEHFRKQYAMVLVQLRDANDLVSSALFSVRHRNMYNGCPSLFLKPLDNTNGMAGIPYSFNQLVDRDSSSQVVEIVDRAQREARTMVDVAVKVICSSKVGDAALTKVGEAIYALEKCQSVSDPGIPSAKSTHEFDGGHLTSLASNPFPSEVTVSNVGHDLKCLITDRDGSQFPSELISSCVSSALMIQRCAETQLPPAEVAQILESAVSSLSPSCSQNIPIYREIEDIMGAIKNQMLALVPSPSLTLPVGHSVA